MATKDVDTGAVEAALLRAAERLSQPALTRLAVPIAHQMIEFAVDSPIPRASGLLADSSVVDAQPDRGVVEFGFNEVYAAFQDQPGKTGFVVVRPRVKKALYIPISRKGEKHRAGANPRTEGLEWGVDYVLRKEVKIPIKPYGSEKGPNHYLSETVRRKTKWFYETLARDVERSLAKDQ